jgi:hypothetical protein
MEEGMKLTKDIMKATGETIAVCEQFDVDPRLVARVLLGVIDWTSSEPPLQEDEDQEPRAKAKWAPKEPEGERDDKGRRIVRRDHNWRENTLKYLREGEKRTLDELVRAVGNVSEGAMVARMRVLQNEGVIEEVHDGVGRLWVRK